MAVGDTYLESDGKAVVVSVTSTVNKGQVAYVDGWLGIAENDVTSGNTVALAVDQREYQIQVPSGLAVAKGAKIYIDLSAMTGHIPQDAAYSTSSGANRVAFFKATAAKDANNIVTGIMLVQ